MCLFSHGMVPHQDYSFNVNIFVDKYLQRLNYWIKDSYMCNISFIPSGSVEL